MVSLMCQECDAREASRDYSLCSACYEDYSVFCEYAERRTEPPAALSEVVPKADKIAILAARWAAGHTLFHPQDPFLPIKDLKERFLEGGVYAKPTIDGDCVYVARLYRPTDAAAPGGMILLGQFDTEKEARKATTDEKARAARKKERKSRGKLGVLVWKKEWWKAFTAAAKKRERALSKMYSRS